MAVRRGVVIVFVLISLAIMASCAGMAMLALMVGGPPPLPSNATLYMPVGMPLPEVEPADVISQLVRRVPTLRETVGAIGRAKRDGRIKSLVISPRASSPLWAQAQELRAAIIDFRTSGKPVTAFLETGGVQEYYVASAADRVVLMPAGTLDLTGIATYEIFLRGTMEKLGVTPDLLHIGDFKTASNTFTERGFTKAHKEMSQSLNRDWYDELVRALADSRKKTPEEIRKLIDGGPYLAEAAKQAGLVDAVAYEDQLDDERPIAGTSRVNGETYLSIGPEPSRSGRIALLYATGTIASGKSSFDGGLSGLVLGSDTFVEWLRKIRIDPGVRAVVIRIDSPGGSAIASEVIWRELMLTREKLPVIVSMGDVAASGGYYIAAPAHAIVAQPGTLTGSIGVVTGKFVLQGGMEKLGVGTDAVSDGRNAQIFSPFRPFTGSERTAIEEQMHATYDLFVKRVAEGRKSTPEKIEVVAQGRVWTGRQALERGLVDELGSLDRAIQIATERARLDPKLPVSIQIYPQRPSFFDLLASPFGSGLSTSLLPSAPQSNVVGQALQAINALERFRRGESLLLMPNVFAR